MLLHIEILFKIYWVKWINILLMLIHLFFTFKKCYNIYNYIVTVYFYWTMLFCALDLITEKARMEMM